MDKVKIEVPNGEWGSLNTKYPSDSDRVADNEFTTGTYNVDTSVKGIITKRLGTVDYADLGGAPKDQYEAIFSDGVRHLLTVVNGTLKYTSGNGQVTNVLSGLTATVNNEFATTQDRVYFGNGLQKKVYDRVTNYGGVTYTFPTQTTKNIGAIAPTTAPSVAVVAGGSVPVGNHTYKVTFLYYDFEESIGGTASGVANVTGGNQTVNLTSIPIGGYGVTARKIYRDNNDGLYYLVTTINDNTTTSYSDTSATVTTAIPTDPSLPPDFTLISLFLDRLFLAGIPGDPYFIYYSEPGYPDIFPATNYIPCNQEDPITGIIVYLDRLIVFNRRSMGQILGRTSDQFRYAQIENSVGCVDNRSIQIRVINGVPVLIWLSDKGFYAYNGNSIVYISDKIEDQVNFNIQQSVIQKNKITHSDYTIFNQGTKSDGINLTVSPGQITTKGPYWDTVAHPGASYDEQTNPKKFFDSVTEWNDGTSKTNLVIDSSTSTLKTPIKFAPALLDGTLSNAIIDGINLKLSIATDFTGESEVVNRFLKVISSPIGSYKVAYSFTPQRSGILKSFGISQCVKVTSSSTVLGRSVVWTDSSGSPGVTIQTGTTLSLGSGTFYPSASLSGLSISLTAGTTYWIGLELLSGTGYSIVGGTDSPFSGGSIKFYNGNWISGIYGSIVSPAIASPSKQYTIQTSAVPKSGQWLSGIYDTGSDSITTTLKITHTGTYPIGSYYGTSYTTSGVTRLEGSNNATFSTGVEVSEEFNNVNGSQSYTLSGKRYWRIRILLNTTDDRDTPIMGTPILTFSTVSEWISEVLDCSSDVIDYLTLDITKNEPVGTSVSLQIATSADNITYPDGFVTFGTETVRQYVKIKAILNSDTNNTITPSISAINFTWKLVSTFISKSIDTGVTPSGWDIFQTSFETNSSAITYSMRSATTEGGLTAATWYSVTNGEFPTSSLPVYQWVQWKAEITSNPDQIPIIDSVTINWFIGSATQNIRCASLFYNTNYYLAAAEFENTTNNLLFIFDQEGKWRVYRNLNIATLSYFFNSPYFGDAVTGKIVRFLTENSDNGSNIPLDFRSKAFDFSTDISNDDKVKILEKAIISGRNTGATYTVEYSVDGGETFYSLKDKNGTSSFTTTADNKGFYKWLRPDFTSSIPSGYSIMLRIYNNDTNEVEIDGFKLYAFVRKHDPIE